MVTPEEKLERYQEMRDFGATPEPSGAEPPQEREGLPRFVVQEHHATALHWDLRLERDGVLVSWAVPRGIPPDPQPDGPGGPFPPHNPQPEPDPLPDRPPMPEPQTDPFPQI